MKGTNQILTALLTFFIVTWGTVTTIMFFGAPSHVNVLVPTAALDSLNATCPTGSAICLGLNVLPTAFGFIFERMGSFVWYFLILILLYLGYIAFHFFVHGTTQIRLTLRPWHMYAAFIGCLWLIFTTLSNGSVIGQENLELRYIIEPSAKIYGNLGEEGMQAMRSHLTNLQDKNCVYDTKLTINEVPVYKMKQVCVQGYFIVRVLSQVLFITFLALLFLATGRAVLYGLKFKDDSLLIYGTLSLFLGAAIWIILLWCMALVALFNMAAIWALIAIVLVGCYKHVWYWLTTIWYYEWHVEFSWNSTIVLTGFLLITLLAFNFLNVVRPFPIGWDDLGVYLNEPRLLTSYGFMTPFMAVFKWEYLTSLGYVLFGYNSSFAATASMLINWLAGIFAVLSLLVFGARLVSMKVAVLAALLYYYLPIVGHFSFADMKTDNAVFALQCISLFAVLVPLYGRTKDEEPMPKRTQYIWYIIAGALLAIGFATKPTSAMMFFANLAIIGAAFTGAWTFIGVAFASLLIFSVQGIFSLTAVIERTLLPVSSVQIQITLAFIAFVCMAVGILRFKKNLQPMAIAGGLFIASFAAVVLPWLTYNNIQSGQFPPSLLMTIPNTLNVNKSYTDLPPELAVDAENPLCKPTAKVEELDRYWGYSSGLKHYILLPWRSVMNIDIAGYYVTSYPYLFLLPLLLLVPFMWESKRRKLYLSLFGATVFLIVQWMFLANGIVWYGIGMFAGTSILLALLTYHSPKIAQVPLVILLVLSVFSAFSMRMWQFGMQQNMVEYAFGKTDSRIMEERTIPYYDDIAAEILERSKNEDRPYVYRIGTFIPYFIPRNPEVFAVQDHQLDIFNCLSQERDDALTLKRLQALGYNSIVFDTNTPTIEKDPNGSLHKKVENFADFINNKSLGLKIMVNDPNAGIAYILLP